MTTIEKLQSKIIENILYIPRFVTTLAEPVIRGIQKSKGKTRSTSSSFSINPRNMRKNLKQSFTQKKQELKDKVSSEINEIKNIGTSLRGGGRTRKRKQKQTRKRNIYRHRKYKRQTQKN